MIDNLKNLKQNFEGPLGLASLICFHIALCCVSLIYISLFKTPDYFTGSAFHIFFDTARLHTALIVTVAFAAVSLIFVFARFSFGYFIGFYLYSMILSYLWINCFSNLDYDHRLGGFSAAGAAIAFLLPALLIWSPVRQRYVLSTTTLKYLLASILLIAAMTIAAGAIYNFRLVGIEDIYDYREQLEFPVVVSYSLAMTSTALLPFAFACFIARKNYWGAAAVLVLLLLFYPIILSKVAFFTPAWLVIMALLSRVAPARTAVMLSLLVPMLAGVLLVLFKTADTPLPFELGARYFYTVNFRIIAVPAAAMDVYSHFFSKHDLTHFCQILVLKPILPCSYLDPLSIVMERTYKLGNYNASLFATEGIASMGLWLAPISVFVCGLVIALGNRVSAGLPPQFVLISAAVFPQILLNVPLSTTLLTHGGALLFLLWYITPRAMFEPDDRTDTVAT